MQGADERLFPSLTASGENSKLLTGYIQAKLFGNEKSDSKVFLEYPIHLSY